MALIWPIPGTKQDWKLRSDVLFHFFAYQHFSHLFNKDAGIDLVNLTDGDVQFYNRTHDNIEGLQTHGKLAKYLSDFNTTHPSLATTASGTAAAHRADLIAHIRFYNKTITPRRRFYMLNLSPTELASLGVAIDFIMSGCSSNVITDGLVNLGRGGNREAKRDEGFVAEKVLDFVDRYQGVPEDDAHIGNGGAIKKIEEHA